MIALILGTSEGKKILSLLNQYTDDILISTATTYGAELLMDYKFKYANTRPLNLDDLIQILEQNKVILLVDASHPYAAAVTENAIEACRILNIRYIRYERPSIAYKFKDKIIKVPDYENLHLELQKVEGTILNTTGSNNIDKFVHMGLKNRIIHRVLPSVDVMEKCFLLGVKPDDIIAIKGPVSYNLNYSFIKEYNATAIVLKDSGLQGGTEEKVMAAVDTGIKIFVLERREKTYENVFNSEEKLVNYIIEIMKL